MNNIPFDYATQNLYNASRNPSVLHARNTGLSNYFKKYLFQKLLSVYEFDGLPEHWEENFFKYVLFGIGWIGIVETDKFGVLALNCGLGGYTVQYQPAWITIANPKLRGMLRPTIGVDCEIIKVQPDYGSVMDIVSYYADILAICSETASVNIMNSKNAFVYVAKNKASAESFKYAYDQMASGQPAVVFDSKMTDKEGNLNIQYFSNNLAQQYIAGDILDDMKKWEDRFDSEIGIPNANTQKKERMITDEVNQNNQDTQAKAILWLETMQKDIEKVNKMFGLNISVKYRYEQKEEIKEPFDLSTLNGGDDNE